MNNSLTAFHRVGQLEAAIERAEAARKHERAHQLREERKLALQEALRIRGRNRS